MRCRCNHAVSRCAECGGTVRVAKPPRKPKLVLATTRAADKAERRERHRAETAAIREVVFSRSFGWCEACFSIRAEVLDHWEGGIGRRRQQQSVSSCWALCRSCDHNRTVNYPDAAWWNAKREFHCRKHGYRFVPHLTRAGAAKREGT